MDLGLGRQKDFSTQLQEVDYLQILKFLERHPQRSTLAQFHSFKFVSELPITPWQGLRKKPIEAIAQLSYRRQDTSWFLCNGPIICLCCPTSYPRQPMFLLIGSAQETNVNPILNHLCVGADELSRPFSRNAILRKRSQVVTIEIESMHVIRHPRIRSFSLQGRHKRLPRTDTLLIQAQLHPFLARGLGWNALTATVDKAMTGTAVIS